MGLTTFETQSAFLPIHFLRRVPALLHSKNNEMRFLH